MSTFKTALRMALAHPLYLLIYTVFISLMGVFIAASVSWNSSQLTEYKPYDANVIVVDRDDSDLSRALTKHLGSRFELVTGIGDAGPRGSCRQSRGNRSFNGKRLCQRAISQ